MERSVCAGCNLIHRAERQNISGTANSSVNAAQDAASWIRAFRLRTAPPCLRDGNRSFAATFMDERRPHLRPFSTQVLKSSLSPSRV